MMEWAVTSSVLVAVVIALRFLFRRRISRRLQYALWGLVLLRLLMPFSLFGSAFSVMNAVPDSKIGENQVYVLPVSSQPVEEASGVSLDHDRIMDANSFGYAVLSENGSTVTRYAGQMSVGEILVWVWLIGGMAVGLWFIGANLVLSNRLRNNREALSIPDCKLPVYVTDHVASPCLFGIIRPAIYLTPKAIENADSTRHVLAHELCHYRHGDHIWSILRCLCLAVWWWNPLVWAASILSRTDGELACDEAVIKKIGTENRFSYGHTLVDMIAVRKAPGIMYAATTMVSGKRGIKERLNMIIKNPKTLISAVMIVLLITAVCVGCTFTGADKGELAPDFPEVDMVFSTDGTDLTQIGCDAASFYYEQFMADDIPQYWHITEHEVLSCELTAGDEKEFVVWVTSYLKTDGGGFLTGQGIPNDPEDINKGGVCPEIGQQFRIKSLGDSRYEIVGIGTGGGDQGLATVAPEGNGDDGPEDVNASIDRTNLEACVSDAILNANVSLYNSGDFAAEAHTVLKTVESGDEATVYTMALYMTFSFDGEELSETGGSHGPVAITFEKSDAGEYGLKEYWTPREGTYAPSIQEKFPADIYEDALDTQKYIDAHIRSCYEQAVAHFHADVDAEISRRIETITSTPSQASDPQAYMEAHEREVNELIYLGTHTLRYCFTSFAQGGQTGLAGHIMAAVCRSILGDAEDIDTPAATGQEWYDALPQSLKDRYR